jgi:hypothetical protein
MGSRPEEVPRGRRASLPDPGGQAGSKRQRSSSRVCSHKATSSCNTQLPDPQTKRKRCIGAYASEEEDAAKAYDCAAVQAHGPGAKHNFPGEAISEAPVSRDGARTGSKHPNSSSRYIGVCWSSSSSSFRVMGSSARSSASG